METTLDQLRAAFDAPDVVAEAEGHLARATELGTHSDWRGTDKELDFARLAVAVHRILPAGGSIETGVLEGGTSAILIMACPRGQFHLSIDPYALLREEFWGDEDLAWETARGALRRLHQLADERGVNYAHYLMTSQKFAQADLLDHPGRFNLVHLDGDHTFHGVTAELLYFTDRITEPVVFVMDDHDDGFPGVEQAMTAFAPEMTRVFHRKYERPPEGEVGFSAWLYPGRKPNPRLRLRREKPRLATRVKNRLSRSA